MFVMIVINYVNQWKEKNREKWGVGGQYYKYEKKKVESS